MASRTFILCHSEARNRALEAVRTAPDGWAVKVGEPTRNLSQNAAQWPILECFAKQKKWPVNGEMVYMSSEDWKNTLTAAFKKETVRMTQGIDGGLVMLGSRTREFTKREFSDWLEFLHATAAHFNIDLR